MWTSRQNAADCTETTLPPKTTSWHTQTQSGSRCVQSDSEQISNTSSVSTPSPNRSTEELEVAGITQTTLQIYPAAVAYAQMTCIYVFTVYIHYVKPWSLEQMRNRQVIDGMSVQGSIKQGGIFFLRMETCFPHCCVCACVPGFFHMQCC